MVPASTGTPSRLYLIDGFSNIFRAYYAIRNLSNRKGVPTGAVFGFLQMLRKLLRDEDPQYIGVALDTGRKTVRSDRYAAYKANRKPMPEDLRSQIPWVRKLLAAYRIPTVEYSGYEADDVLGTLAKKAQAAGFEVILVSPDKDLMQLVGNGVFQDHTGRERRYDAAGVAEDFGVAPQQVVDVLSLVGDASDNVPGVPGIGAKGARALIAEFGSLDALLERASQIKRKSYRENLIAHREQALLSRELVTIHTDLPVPFEPASLRRDPPDWEALLAILNALDFDHLRRELEAEHGQPALGVQPAIEADVRAGGLGGLKRAATVALAAIGADSADAPIGLAVAALDGQQTGEEATLFVDFRQAGQHAAAVRWLAARACDTGATLVGHDLKETLRLLATSATLPPVRCRLLDTMLLSYLADSARRSHDLAGLASDRLHHTAMKPAEAGWSKQVAPMPGLASLRCYAAEQVVLPMRLLPTLDSDLGAGLQALYERIEAPLVPVLLRMEGAGIALDSGVLGAQSQAIATQIDALEAEIYELADERFNIKSPQQLGVILFEKLGYPVLGRTRKTRGYATGAAVLEELAARGHTLPERLLRFRELTKLRSTYLEALPALVGADGRLHTRFNQAVAATGRLSSSNPNLQNIPVRTALGAEIRKGFVAPPGRRLVVADYSQIELRVLAHMAGEQAMLDGFARGDDIHVTTAAQIFGLAPLLVSPDQRRMAKTINFGILYGMSDWGLARRLGISKADAGAFIASYKAQYPAVARYTEETAASAEASGSVSTLYGRIRTLPDIKSRNHNLREAAKRMAINAPIQGTAADLIKLAMIAVDARLASEQPESRLILTVHDELIIEAPEADVEIIARLVREEMVGVAELRVPLEVDVGTGASWFEAKQ